MAPDLQNWYFQTLIFCVTLFGIIVSYFYRCYQYWDKKGVPSIPPHFPFGNSTFSLPKSFTIGTLNKEFYDYFKRKGYKFGGVYLITEPNLVIVDPELIKDILCKDFQSFVDRGFYFNQKDDPISANIFTLDGLQWKNLRVKLTPTFTSNKMKMMFRTMVECSQYLVDHVRTNIDEDLDMKDIAGKFTTDVIGSSAFGIECNSFKYPDAEFRKMGKKIFHFDFWRSLRAFVIVNLPKLSLKLGVTSNNKDVRDFFSKTVKDAFRMRKETGMKRNDFIQILMDLEDKEIFSLEEITAQVFLFFLAGFETSSTTISFILYELARNPEIQEKVRKEVCQVLEKYNNEFTYEGLGEMTYLRQVFEESMRLWPPALTLNRRCTQNYKIPDSNITVEKGTPLLISVFGIHMDPEYYPEPEKFDPERFSEEQKTERHPCVYLPFGDGPRNCIGQRFGLMQSRVGVANIIKNFKISVSPNTKKIEIDPGRFLLSTLNPIYLIAEKL